MWTHPDSWKHTPSWLGSSAGFEFKYPCNLLGMCQNFMYGTARPINKERLVQIFLFFIFLLFFSSKRREQRARQFSSYRFLCTSHPFQTFNAAPLPRGSVCITRWEVAWRAEKFLMSSSKFRSNHREADFYLSTFQRSNCVMRPFSKWCPGRVQSKSCSKEIWFKFHSVKSKCVHAKVILVSTTPFETLERGSFGILKDTFQSIKKDFTPLVLWQPSISSRRSQQESYFVQNCRLSHSLSTPTHQGAEMVPRRCKMLCCSSCIP